MPPQHAAFTYTSPSHRVRHCLERSRHGFCDVHSSAAGTLCGYARKTRLGSVGFTTTRLPAACTSALSFSTAFAHNALPFCKRRLLPLCTAGGTTTFGFCLRFGLQNGWRRITLPLHTATTHRAASVATAVRHNHVARLGISAYSAAIVLGFSYRIA